MNTKETIRAVLKELILPEINIIKQSHQRIETQLELTNRRIDDINKRIDDINLHLVELSRRVDETNKRLDRLY